MNLPSDAPQQRDLRASTESDKKVTRVLLVAVTMALGWILLPFWGMLLWSVIISVLFAPLNRLILKRWPGRCNLAALLTMLVVLLIVVLPFFAITAALVHEWTQFYAQLQSGEVNPGRFWRQTFSSLPASVRSVLDRLGMSNFDALQSSLSTSLAQVGKFIASQAVGIGQNTFGFIAGLFLSTYLSFFLLRDGQTLTRRLRQGLPLTPLHQNALLDKFTTVLTATVKGSLLVALAQGALGGLAFWVLGVSGAILWAVLMAFLSLVPAVGAALVWLPVAIYFFMNGQVAHGAALVIWGVLVIGLVDNLLRPLLVGRETRMPDYVVLISTLGGISTFGIHGFVLGPLLAAMFMTVWNIRSGGTDSPEPPT